MRRDFWRVMLTLKLYITRWNSSCVRLIRLIHVIRLKSESITFLETRTLFARIITSEHWRLCVPPVDYFFAVVKVHSATLRCIVR